MREAMAPKATDQTVKQAIQDLIAPELERIEGQMAALDAKIGAMDAKIDAMETKLSAKISMVEAVDIQDWGSRNEH
jgi:hypothetical protein